MIFKKIAIIFICLLWSLPVKASSLEVEAEAWAKARGEEALHAFAEVNQVERFAKIDALVLENFDIEAIGRFVVGRYWRYMSKDVADYYLRVFERYLLASYKSMQFTVSKDAYLESVTASKAENDSDNAIVINAVIASKTKDVSEVKKDADNDAEKVNDSLLSLDFRIKKEGDSFKIFDIKIADVSSLLVYRDKFSQMIKERENDLLWFIEDLDIDAEEMENEIMRKCPKCTF